MAGLSDIESLPGEPLYGRPLVPVPQVVQSAHRKSPIDDGGAWDGISREAIFPGRSEEDERFVGWRRLDERAGGLVNVLADARPFAKRGSVIDEDPHDRTPDAITRYERSPVRGAPQVLACQSIDTF
jgi:hypothetical protein